MNNLTYVTGSSGFLGKHLVSKLGEYTVTIPHEEICDHQYEDCRNFYFLSSYGNMSDHTDVSEILRGNVAQVGRVVGGIIDGEFRCEHLIFVSSSSVLLPVQTPYSRAKRACEEMILASGISASIVRPFSVTGVGEQKQHLIPTLIRSCLTGEPMKLSPDPTHDFIDVSDVCDGLIALADRRANGIFEIGNGLPFTNGEVCNMVEGICGQSAKVILVEKKVRSYDNNAWFCQDFEARRQGWKPKKTLHDSISEMVEAHHAQ